MSPRYSLDRHDKKVAGVASTLGEVFNIDPTFVRIAFVAIALLISIKLAIIAYIGAGIYLHTQKHRAEKSNPPPSQFDRMAAAGKVRVEANHITLDEVPAAYERLDKGEHGVGRTIAVP